MSDRTGALCEVGESEVTIGNRWLRRTFGLKDGCATTRFEIRPWGEGTWLSAFAFVGAYPLEAQIIVSTGDNGGGELLRVGLWKHERFGHVCDWECIDYNVEDTDVGVRLDIRLRPRSGNAPHLELMLHQEVANDAPYIKRWVTVVNKGHGRVAICGMVVEVLPSLRVGRQLHVIDAYVSPRVTVSEDFIGWQFHEFDRGPDVALDEGESFESFAVYTLPYADGAEERLSAINALLRTAAPWTTRPLLRHEFGTVKPWQETVDLARRSADHGFEELASFVNVHFTNTGDFALNPEVFPNGEDDFKRMVDGIHDVGLKYVTYVGFCIANHWSDVCEEHPDWQFVGPEGRGYDPGGIGNMCMMSGWGEFFLDRCRWLTDEVGVDGLQTDGCYMGQACHATNHAHATPGEAQYRNWRYEMDFYREMREKGKLIETPSSMYALLHGANCLPQGYHEEDAETLGLFELVTAFRSRLYTGQMRGLPGWAAWGFAMVDELHGHGIYPPEEHLHEFEHLIAGHISLGLSGFYHGWNLMSGPKSEDVLRRWIGFFKEHRDTLGGDAVFIEPPTGLRPDAVMHGQPGANTPAVLVGVNPLARRLAQQWTVPLWRAGFGGGDGVLVQTEAGSDRQTLDDVGNLALTARFDAYEAQWWSFRPV